MTMDENMGGAIRSGADDKRKYHRFSVAFPVSFGDEGAVRFGMVVDISREGCRIRCGDPAPGDQYFKVEIWLNSSSDRLVIDLAVMRWSRPEEFGIEFIGMTPDNQASLRRIIRHCEEAAAKANGDGDLPQPCCEVGRRPPHDGRP